MEIEFDFRKNEEWLWVTGLVALVVAVFFGLAQIGRNVTPLDTGEPRLLGWSDWRLLQAERAYAAEISVLRDDAMQLVAALEQRPNPVAAQLLAERIARHAKEGDPSLANARLALANASLMVRDWATGIQSRDAAILAVQEALTLLQ